jgi:cytochrome c biogenesis protein CcmG/thiol:disulfide interchange protein DsbE
MADHEVMTDSTAGHSPEQPPHAGPARGPRGALRLIRQHKLVTGIVVALIVAVVSGVSSGSLRGTPASGSQSGGSQSGSTANTATIQTFPNPAAAPAFSLPALADPAQQVSLSQYQGKPLIVNFWASWCGPCQQETPLLASFYKANGARVAIVGIDSNDSTANAIKFARAKGVGYPVGVDSTIGAADAYNVAALPQTFFLDARHRVVERAFGALTQAELQQGVRLMAR